MGAVCPKNAEMRQEERTAELITLQHNSRADAHLLLFHVQQITAKLASAKRIC